LTKNVTIRLYDCNRCGRNGCRGDIIRDGKGGIKKFIGCPGMVTPDYMRCTLLERASENHGSFIALGTILEQMDLQFDEIPRWPYFRFIFKESQQEVQTII